MGTSMMLISGWLATLPSALCQGVVINYREPPEARQPKTRWRLYPFKGDETLRKFGLVVLDNSAYIRMYVSVTGIFPSRPPYPWSPLHLFLLPHVYSNALCSPPECLPHWQRQAGRWIIGAIQSGRGTELYFVHVCIYTQGRLGMRLRMNQLL